MDIATTVTGEQHEARNSDRFGERVGPMGWFALLAILVLLWQRSEAVAFAPNQAGDNQAGSPSVALIPVPFPLSAATETRLIERLDRMANQAIGGERSIAILEFTKAPDEQSNPEKKNSDETTLGRGTSFERSLTLARWLSGPKASRIRSVAFLPNSICGHAVLVALGCEEIAIANDADFGRAGVDESPLDATVRQAYLDVASRRSSFPPAAVLSMLDPAEGLVQVGLTGNRVEYATVLQLSQRQRSEEVQSERELVPINRMAEFMGTELRTLKWVANRANDREQLAEVLKLTKPPSEQPVFAGPRVAVRVHLKGIISSRQVTRIMRALDEGLSKPETNLILVDVDSPGGNLAESIRLSQFLADIPSERAEVVSYISGNALGDAALVPLASDLILMHPDAKLGGAGEATITPAICNEQKSELKELAKSTGRSDGELLGCICPDMKIFEFNSIEGRAQLNNPQWIVDDANMPQWTQGPAVSFAGGLSFERANELALVSDNPVSLQAVGNRFGIDKLPEETQTNATEQFVEWLGGQGWLSMFLFMVGIICLSAELSTPGIGIAGILSAICFLLFFWIHLFQGTVEWLEILLILAGVLCLAAELFILPGFGVFGVTGLLLLAVGLLLAGQTFVLPTNDYQWERTAEGIGQLGLLVSGLFVSAVVFRKQLAKLPMIRWFSLQPPTIDRDLVKKNNEFEELRTYIGWHGITISRCNPSGKASIGDRIFSVSSDGAWIDEDTEIEVTQLHEHTLIVKPR